MNDFHKIAGLIGPSGSGKDSIFATLKKVYQVKPIIPYTTRPMRPGEKDGKEYYFVSQEKLDLLEQKKMLIERRNYNTEKGLWSYATAKSAIDLTLYDYAIITTWSAYEQFLKVYPREILVPIYIEVEEGLRLQRCLNREREGNENYSEMCRRFLADSKDFSLELKEKYKPEIIINNGTLKESLLQLDDILVRKLGFERRENEREIY